MFAWGNVALQGKLETSTETMSGNVSQLISLYEESMRADSHQIISFDK